MRMRILIPLPKFFSNKCVKRSLLIFCSPRRVRLDFARKIVPLLLHPCYPVNLLSWWTGRDSNPACRQAGLNLLWVDPRGISVNLWTKSDLVDPKRFELSTSSMPSRRASRCATGPFKQPDYIVIEPTFLVRFSLLYQNSQLAVLLCKYFS